MNSKIIQNKTQFMLFSFLFWLILTAISIITMSKSPPVATVVSVQQIMF